MVPYDRGSWQGRLWSTGLCPVWSCAAWLSNRPYQHARGGGRPYAGPEVQCGASTIQRPTRPESLLDRCQDSLVTPSARIQGLHPACDRADQCCAPLRTYVVVPNGHHIIKVRGRCSRLIDWWRGDPRDARASPTCRHLRILTPRWPRRCPSGSATWPSWAIPSSADARFVAICISFLV